MARRKQLEIEGTEKEQAGGLLPKGIVCKECAHAVDVIVTRDQVIGHNEFLCIGCKIDRMRERVEEKIEALQIEAREARAALSQMALPL